MRSRQRLAPVLLATAALFTFAQGVACGETRRALGEACLRSDDCLSGTCSDRLCVAAPPLGQPDQSEGSDAASASSDAGAASTATDASGDAGD